MSDQPVRGIRLPPLPRRPPPPSPFGPAARRVKVLPCEDRRRELLELLREVESEIVLNDILALD